MGGLYTARQVRYFEHARQMAQMSDFTRARVGCVVVEGKRIVGMGFSSHRTHPLQKHYNQYRNFTKGKSIVHSLHAEIMALAPIIGSSEINWNKVEIYVYRICRSREYGMARPCSACMNCISDCHIRDVYYTTDVGYAHERIA